MARSITTHKVNKTNEALRVEVMDDPGHGGAHHHYEISTNLYDVFVRIEFQNGPIKEVGVNGITHETLLAVLIDRLQCFQAGDYACRENALALTKLEEAQHWLHHRTRACEARGVEGTHEV